MALSNLGNILKDHSWPTYVLANLVLVLVEKLVEQDFVCPCRLHYTEAFFSLYLLMPLLITLNFGVYLWKTVDWSKVEIPKQLCDCICQWESCVKILTCSVPTAFWLSLFFGDGRFLACLKTPLKDGHIQSDALPPWEWCDKNRTLTDDQYRSQIRFYVLKIAVFGILFFFFLGVLIFQCCDRCWVKCCGGCCDICCNKCYAKCCGGCCVQCCGECCVGCYEEYREIRMEQLLSSTYKVLCVAVRETTYSRHLAENNQEVKLALCSVCDGTRVFLITLQGDQIHMFEEGETYNVKNATVKKNGLFDEMILGSKPGVYRTAPLQLEENLYFQAMEKCFSKTTALKDKELYLKKSFITLTGTVISTRTPRQNQEGVLEKEIVIEQENARVAVSLLTEAANKPLEKDQMIKITHVKVTKNKECGRKLTSSDHTVITEGAEGEESFVKVEAYNKKNNQIILLTEDQEELSVPQNLWPRDVGHLSQQLPVYLLVTRRGEQVTRVDLVKSQRTKNVRSLTYKVLCVAKRATKSSGGSIKLSLCSVCDGTRVFLITLQEDQICMFQEGQTYNVTNTTVKQDGLFDEMILESKPGVYETAPLQLEENLYFLAMERCFSKTTALNDPELYLKKSYITLTGKVVSTRTPGQNQQEKEIEIEQDGVRVPVLLLKEAAKTPLQINQMIKITYIKVTKNKECGRKLTSSDHTDVPVLEEGAEEEEESFVKVEAFRTENNKFILLTDDQEELSVRQDRWPRDAGQLPEQLPVYLIVTRRGGQVTCMDVVKSQM